MIRMMQAAVVEAFGAPLTLRDWPADIARQSLSAINAIFDWLEHGQVASRVVLDFGN